MKCYSCMRPIKAGAYCAGCKKSLFNDRIIRPLKFDKSEFYRIKSEMTDRMSLSGVQDKISLTFGGEGELVPTATNGRFILKPIPRNHDNAINLEDIAANEHLSMQISQQIFKIPTAMNGLIEFKGGELAYITKRFDYALNVQGEVEKLDQEDFASVLQYTKDSHGDNYKYDSSYQKIAQEIEKFVPAFIPALEDLYKRIVFNYLIGNGDAHLKNFSLLRGLERPDYSLSPNYDVLFTKYHLPKEEGIMGIELFEEDFETTAFGAMGFYTLEDFEVLAGMFHIKEKRLIKIFKDILTGQDEVLRFIENSFLSDSAKAAYEENYRNRLRNCLCYSIKGYSFRGVTQDVITASGILKTPIKPK